MADPQDAPALTVKVFDQCVRAAEEAQDWGAVIGLCQARYELAQSHRAAKTGGARARRGPSPTRKECRA